MSYAKFSPFFVTRLPASEYSNNLLAVEKALAQADKPIGGIIEAAMGLSEALFA